MREIKVGDRFGRLVVIKEVSRGKYLLRCDCGNTIEIVGAQLRAGKRMSCGCSRYSRDVKKNLVGKRYGRLVVTEELGHGYVMCHCDCGNDKKIRKWQIMQGAIHSCGCLRRETVPNHSDIKSLAKDGTNLSMFVSKKLRRDNTSGVKGVTWDKARSKWVGGIKVKGKEKKKRFDTLEEAAEYRKMLEELYVEPLLEKEQINIKEKQPIVPDKELRDAREKACVTRQTVHDRTGLSIVSLQRWENGWQHPTVEARNLLLFWYRSGCPVLPAIGVADDKPDGDYLIRLEQFKEENENAGQ